jgi:CBS domain-containing protein
VSLKRFIKRVESISPRAMVADACREMKEKNIGALVVISDDNKPLGVLTDRDVIVRAIVEGKTAERTPVEEVMTSPVAALQADATFEEATELMCSRSIRRVPIVDQGQHLVGLVSFDDVVLLLGIELGNLAGAVGSTVAAVDISQSARQENMQSA